MWASGYRCQDGGHGPGGAYFGWEAVGGVRLEERGRWVRTWQWRLESLMLTRLDEGIDGWGRFEGSAGNKGLRIEGVVRDGLWNPWV